MDWFINLDIEAFLETQLEPQLGLEDVEIEEETKVVVEEEVDI